MDDDESDKQTSKDGNGNNRTDGGEEEKAEVMFRIGHGMYSVCEYSIRRSTISSVHQFVQHSLEEHAYSINKATTGIRSEKELLTAISDLPGFTQEVSLLEEYDAKLPADGNLDNNILARVDPAVSGALGDAKRSLSTNKSVVARMCVIKELYRICLNTERLDDRSRYRSNVIDQCNRVDRSIEDFHYSFKRELEKLMGPDMKMTLGRYPGVTRGIQSTYHQIFKDSKGYDEIKDRFGDDFLSEFEETIGEICEDHWGEDGQY